MAGLGILARPLNREGLYHREPCGWPRILGREPGVSMVNQQRTPKGGLTYSTVLCMALISFLHSLRVPETRVGH